MAKRHFEIFASLSIVALSLSGCGQAFDRYMQEGQKLRDHQDLAKAREKFHAAVLEARSEKKKSDHLLTALQAETECLETLKQYDDEAVLLDEEARTLEKANEFKRAAAVRKQIGDISMQAPNTSAAMQAYEDALADLKKIKAENSHYGAEILFAMGDVKVA